MDSQLKMGDEATVIVYHKKEAVGEITIQIITEDEAAAAVYTDNTDTLAIVEEILNAALECVKFHTARPNLRKMLAERIAQMRAEIAAEESEPPSPTDDYDLPF